MPEGDTIRRLAERIDRRVRRPALPALGDARPPPDQRRLHRRRADRRRRRRQAPAHPLRRRPHAVRPPADDRLVRGRAGGDGAGVAAARRAVDGGRPADRRRRAGARGRRHRRRGRSIVGHLGPDLCGPEPPDLDEVTARLQREPDVPLAGALARPAQRGRLRQPLRRRAAVHRRCLAEPAGRLRRRARRPRRARHGADPHQRRPRPAEHDRPSPHDGRPLDLRAGAAGPARCAAPGSTAGTSRDEPVAAAVDVVPGVPAAGGAAHRRRRAGPPAAGPPPGPQGTARYPSFTSRRPAGPRTSGRP